MRGRTRCTTRCSTCSPRWTRTTSSSISRTLFASARQGWAATSLEAEHKDMAPLFDLILRHVPAPHVEADKPFRMLVTTLEYDPFLGRLLTGRIQSGAIKPNTDPSR